MYNFNGKFYNKSGHLGMTTAQVKEALAGGGGGSPFYYINLSYDEDDNPVLDKTFAEITAAATAGMIPYIIYNDTGHYAFFDIMEIEADYVRFKSVDFSVHDETSFYITNRELTLRDTDACTEVSDIYYLVSDPE